MCEEISNDEVGQTEVIDGLGSPHKVFDRLDPDEKGVSQIDTPGGYGCFSWGYRYGFAEGRRAEKNADRRERRAKQRKGAV